MKFEKSPWYKSAWFVTELLPLIAGAVALAIWIASQLQQS